MGCGSLETSERIPEAGDTGPEMGYYACTEHGQDLEVVLQGFPG